MVRAETFFVFGTGERVSVDGAIDSLTVVVNFNFFRAVSVEGSKLNWLCNKADYVTWTNGTDGYRDA